MSRRVYQLGVGLSLALAFTDWALSLRPGVAAAHWKDCSASCSVG